MPQPGYQRRLCSLRWKEAFDSGVAPPVSGGGSEPVSKQGQGYAAFSRRRCRVFGFRPGDQRCLCALQLKEAYDAGVAPPVGCGGSGQGRCCRGLGVRVVSCWALGQGLGTSGACVRCDGGRWLTLSGMTSGLGSAFDAVVALQVG